MNKFAKPSNFGHPIRTPLLREHFVYRAFNRDGELLYVGCTKNLATREKEHRMDSDWYPAARRFSISGPHNYETARLLEREAIHNERPLYNLTPERRAVKAAHQRVLKRRQRVLVAQGVEFWAAHKAAERHAKRIVPPPSGRGPWRCDDLTVAAAKRADREDAASYMRVAS